MRIRLAFLLSAAPLGITEQLPPANANPMVFQGKNGKEYVAIVAGRAVHTFALP